MKISLPRFRQLATVTLAVSLLFVTGCRLLFLGGVVGAAVATVAFVDGKLVDTVSSPFDKVTAATDKAISQLGFAQAEVRRDALSATFNTHTAKGDSVEIVESNVADTATKVTIRVNTFGDRAMSETI